MQTKSICAVFYREPFKWVRIYKFGCLNYRQIKLPSYANLDHQTMALIGLQVVNMGKNRVEKRWDVFDQYLMGSWDVFLLVFHGWPIGGKLLWLAWESETGSTSWCVPNLSRWPRQFGYEARNLTTAAWWSNCELSINNVKSIRHIRIHLISPWVHNY